jgi:hypothetical protein
VLRVGLLCSADCVLYAACGNALQMNLIRTLQHYFLRVHTAELTAKIEETGLEVRKLLCGVLLGLLEGATATVCVYCVSTTGPRPLSQQPRSHRRTHATYGRTGLASA